MKFKCINEYNRFETHCDCSPFSCCDSYFKEEEIYEGYLNHHLKIDYNGKLNFEFECIIFRGDEDDVDGYDTRIGITITSINAFNKYFSVVEGSN